MSNPLKKLGKFVDKNKWTIATIAIMGYTGYAAFGTSAGLTAGQSVALATAANTTGQMAAGDEAEYKRQREEARFNKNDYKFGLNRNATQEDAERLIQERSSNARPMAQRTQGSRAMASAAPQSPRNLDDIIKTQHA